MLKTRKAEVVAELEEQLKDSSALIIAHYRGLSVGQLAGVRRDLAGLDATLRVTKNTLAKRAAEEAGIDGLEGLLDGPTAIAFCRGDAAAVAKRLSDAARETRVLALRGAVLDGRALDEDGVKRLATLPPKEHAAGHRGRHDRGAAHRPRLAAGRRAARARGRDRPDHPEEAGAGGRVGLRRRSIRWLQTRRSSSTSSRT